MTRRTVNRAVTCCFFGLEAMAVYSTSAISASDVQRFSSLSHTALGYLIGLQASSSIAAMAALTEAFIRTATENRASRARQAAITSAA